MPLLGTKVFVPNEIANGFAPPTTSESFYLTLTNEVFDSIEEYEERVRFYDRPIWACRNSGHQNLSYGKAVENELKVHASVRKSFPTVFEPAVLHFVHTSRTALPPLIDSITKMLSERLFVDEPVEFKLRKNVAMASCMRGTICFKDGSTDASKDPNLTIFADFLSSRADNVLVTHKSSRYYVKLDNSGRIIGDVPGEELVRLTHVPSKEVIRVFVRCHAIRYGVRADSPWVVNENMRERAGISDGHLERSIELAIAAYTVYSKHMKLKKAETAEDGTVTQNGGQLVKHIGNLSIVTSLVPKTKTTLSGPLKSNGTMTESTQQKNTDVDTLAVDQLLAKCKRADGFDQLPVTEHPSVLRVMSEIEKNGIDNSHTKSLISRLANELSSEQRESLPTVIKEKVMTRLEVLAEKQKYASMSEHDRKVYLSNKIKKRMIEVKAAMREKRGKELADDLIIPRPKPIPEPSLIATPDNLPNESLGDVFFICEFFRCFKRVIGPTEKIKLDTASIFEMLMQPKPVFVRRCAKIIQMLVRTILTDENFNDIRCFNVLLERIPICEYSSAQFARLCVRRWYDLQDYPPDIEIDSLLDRIEQVDFEDLSEVDILQYISVLCHVVLDCESVVEESDTINEEVKTLKKEVATLMLAGSPSTSAQSITKPVVAKTKKEEDAIDNGKGFNTCNKDPQSNQRQTTIDNFVIRKRRQEGANLIENIENQSESEPRDSSSSDAATKKTSSRLVAMKQRQEQLQLEKEGKIRAQEHAEKAKVEDKRQLALQTAEKRLGCKVTSLRDLVRLNPLGVDAYYNRYWSFNCFGGLLVEKVDGDAGYEDIIINNDNWQIQSKWFCYATVDELNALVESLLPNGCRESVLLTNLKKQRANIEARITRNTTESVKSMSLQSEKTASEYEISFDTLLAARDNLENLEYRIRSGSLGGVDSWDGFLKILHRCENIRDLNELTVQVEKGVNRKFSEGFLRQKPMNESSDQLDSKHELDWVNAVMQCKSATYLYFLTDALDSCIRWSMSVENARSTSRQSTNNNNGRNAVRSRAKTQENNETGNQRRKSMCTVCKDRCDDPDSMATCRQCSNSIHLCCHTPPIRRTKRNEWICNQCRNVDAPLDPVHRLRSGGRSDQSERTLATAKHSTKQQAESRWPSKRARVTIEQEGDESSSSSRRDDDDGGDEEDSDQEIDDSNAVSQDMYTDDEDDDENEENEENEEEEGDDDQKDEDASDNYD